MAWRIVKQPNGLLARFSDIVDSFTDGNMNEREAYRLCRERLGIDAAKRKVRAGLEDWKPWTIECPSEDGLSRWRDSIETVKSVHGEEKAQEFIEALGNNEEVQAAPSA